MHWIELIGYLASGLVFLTFCMKTMLPLRLVGIGSNLAFISYGYFGEIGPVLHLHLVLLPVNVYRLIEMQRLVARVRAASVGTLDPDWLLAHMTQRSFPEGHVLFRRGETAHHLYYVVRGRVQLAEVGTELGAGDLLGEIALFAPDKKRTSTAVALEPCELGEISDAKVAQLYFQNPHLAFYLVRLITSRLGENNARYEDAIAEIRGGGGAPGAEPAR